MRVGHLEIRCGLTWEIWEGRTLKYKLDSFDEALDLADDLLEEDREREERQQFGTAGIGSDKADRDWKHRHEESV